MLSFQCRICQQCWLAYRKYSAVTPGGMSKDAPANVVGNTSKFPGLKNTAKKATTLFLTPTLMARVSRKLPGDNVRVVTTFWGTDNSLVFILSRSKRSEG